MIRIHRKLEYALMALKHMSERHQGELTTVKEICQAYDCPFDATSRVMQSLARSGILRSEQGAYGGYQLVKDPKKVTMLSVIEAVVGPLEVARCVSDPSDCSLSAKCNIMGPIHFLNDQILAFYGALRLGDMLSASAKGASRETSESNRPSGTERVSSSSQAQTPPATEDLQGGLPL